MARLPWTERVAKGDLEAFAVLYAWHRPEILRYASKRSRSTELAEDITSEVFLRALQRLDRFHGGNFAAWLMRIATNVLADHYRSAPATREVSLEVSLECQDVTEPAPGPELDLIRRSEQHRLMRALEAAWHDCARLNDDHRLCLSLRFLEGMTIAQTAELMGRSEGAVKLLQHRATRVLRRHLALSGADN